MIAALLLAATPIATATDAEIAFARDAKRIGQWSAFRKWADRDAVMFTPNAVWARTFLKSRKDPPRSISWRASESFVSCDGRTAVNVGPWFTQDAKFGGYFSTVWQRTRAGWRWVYDGGIETPVGAVGKTKQPKVRRASCNDDAPGPPLLALPEAKLTRAPASPIDLGRGLSADKTLGWDWRVAKDGSRTLRVFLWTSGGYAEVIHARGRR